MKAKQLLNTVLIGIFIIFSGNTILSQERRSDRSQGKRSNENSRSRVKRQSTSNYSYQSNAQNNSNKNKHNKANKVQKHRQIDSHCYIGCNVSDHHSSTIHVHKRGYNHHSHHNHYVYLPQLPSPYYLSFAIGYDTFYHCMGNFYTYIPGRGYIAVELQLPRVRYAPRHCMVTQLNGYSYYNNSDYYYIPVKNGYYRVRNNSAQVICRLKH